MELEKKYNRWKKLLIAGLVLWLPFAGLVLLGNGLIGAGAGIEAAKVQEYGWILNLMILFALPLGLVCFFWAKRNRQKNIAAAIRILYAPFIYLFVFLIFYFSVIPV